LLPYFPAFSSVSIDEKAQPLYQVSELLDQESLCFFFNVKQNTIELVWMDGQGYLIAIHARWQQHTSSFQLQAGLSKKNTKNLKHHIRVSQSCC